MFTKLLRKFSCFISSGNNNAKFITTSCWVYQLKTRDIHNWKRQMVLNQEKRKFVPKLVYLHNPLKHLWAKINILKIRIFWDRNFSETEFIRGAKQAAVTITKIIRDQNNVQVRQLATPMGYKQITRDMLLSRDDSRLKLVRFESEHLRRAIPINVAMKQVYGHRYCFIDMLFVGLRNTKDFESVEEAVEIKGLLQKLDADLKTHHEVLSAPQRILFAEIFVRFRRNYTEYTDEPNFQSTSDNEDRDWSVSFYKILTFDVLNFDPK